MKRIECIIMDWAGTAVDYGCFAPVAAFVESFRAIGVPVTPIVISNLITHWEQGNYKSFQIDR